MSNLLEWRVGVEWFKNESEKEFDGITLIKGNNAEELEPSVVSLAEHLQIVAHSMLTDTPLRSNLIPTKFTPEFAGLVRNKLVWFHIMHKPTLDKMPKSMFEKQPDELLDGPEKSFDEIMGGTQQPLQAPVQIPEHDRYFNADGVLINGIPDFWALQAGLV